MADNELLAWYEPQPTETLQYERQLWQARYSPCGRFLVACGYDATVQLWDVSQKPVKHMEPLLGHNGWVQCMDFQPAAKRLFTADSWGKIACWAYAQPQPDRLWHNDTAHDGWIRDLAVSPDGKWLASCGNDRVVRIWSTEDGRLHQELGDHPLRIFSVCFHPDGKSLVSGDLQGAIRQWDFASGKRIKQFDAAALYQHHRIQHCGGARRLAFDAAGQLLVCGGQKNPAGGFATGLPAVLVFDVKTGQPVQEMQVGSEQDGFVYDARFHPDGFVMATSCAFPGKGHLWFWKPGDEKAFYISKNLPNGRSLSLHPDGHTLAMLVSLSTNGNGRQLKDGQYLGGTAQIQLLRLKRSVKKSVKGEG